ncbi:type 2 DNA topoisomerase 6 subunit B-like isoform X4 [Brachyhypopomus gauderio]
MTSKLQQVIRLLMVLTRNDYTESKRSSARPDGRGGLLVLRVHSMQAVRRPTYTECQRNMSRMRLQRDFLPVSIFVTVLVKKTFKCSQTSLGLCILFARSRTTRTSRKRRPLLQHFFKDSVLLMLRTPFTMACLPTCTRMHPVLGERVALLLPSEVMEAGLCGELSMATLATLRPCMDQYPNWPTRLSHIHVLVYSPSGVPLKRGEGATQLSFLHSLADSPAWVELGLARVRHAESQSGQGSVSCEVEFSVDDEDDTQPQGRRVEPEHTVQQTVMLFLLFEYRDPFHSQLSDVIGTVQIRSEETLERCLDKVLWYNDDKVRSALQSLLKSALRGFLKRNKSQERLQSAMSVILSSVKSIVSSSSSVDFRTACLTTMKVQSSYDLSFPLHQKLQRVING